MTTSRRSVRPPSASVEWPLLAAAVVRQAILDASSPVLPPAEREQAQRFLDGDPMYRFWSAVAALGLADRPGH